jgi:histidinol-phosphate/aromatic aminotransferase/cobyric acid decarboxylase-like protein
MVKNSISFTNQEKDIAQKIKLLKEEAGSHSPSIYTIAEKLPQLNIIVDACFLSNPYATDLFFQSFTEELIDSGKIKEVLEYYPSQNQTIAEVLSKPLNVSPKNIFVGNGTTEIIQAVIHNFTAEKIVVNIPTFSPYYEFVKDGIEVVYNKLDKQDNFVLNLEYYIQLVKKEKPDTIVLINPNNPDGGYINLERMEYFVSELSWVKNVIVDESFIHFAYEDVEYNLRTLTEISQKFPNLVLVKSMSKDFGIAGIRAGYAIMDEHKVNRLLKQGYLWNLSGLAEYFFRLYVRNDFLRAYEKVRIPYIQASQQFFSKLAEIKGLKVYPSMANFVLVELINGATSTDFTAKLLLKYGIYIRNCADKIGLDGQFVRIASRTTEQNQWVMDSITDLFREV